MSSPKDPNRPTPTGMFERFGENYTAGTVLFREGDPGKHMYVIQSGRIELTRRVRGKEAHLATLPAGEFFGEMAIINKHPRSATATALEDSHLLVLDARTFEAMIRGNAEIAIRMIKKLAARLAQANSQVETLLKQDLNHRIVHQLRVLADSRGQSDGPGVRIDISIDELAETVAATPKDVVDGLERLEKARLIDKQPGSIFIAEVGKLAEFLEFLEMKERFGS
ncbi:MAG: Cyclic nucleotide-binding domain protein [Myxococcales bacterium]|nr:Cyclic nucleotide-binding domain protein [Myxococcales bacterium]